MSRGGARGGRGGGRGGFRGGFGGASSLPPMGLTFADIQSMSKEATALYPTMDPLPTLSAITQDEREVAQLQLGVIHRLRQSPYYLVEHTKTSHLSRYSDKYRPKASAQPTLKKSDVNPSFFPPDLFDAHFNARKKRKISKPSVKKTKINLDDMNDEREDDKSASDKDSQQGSEEAQEDYDDEEEDDNDYAENYFDNGEGDDLDDLGGGDDGGGGEYD